MRIVILVAAIAGCGRIGFDDLGPGGGPGGGDARGDGNGPGNGDGGNGDSGGNPDSNPLLACASDLGSMTGNVVFDSGTLGGMDHYGSCGGAGAPDEAFAWTAPSTGTFTFDLCASSSNFDSLLYAYTACNGTGLLGCADNECPDGVNARLSLSLSAGEQILLIVDGNAAAMAPNFDVGDFELGIH